MMRFFFGFFLCAAFFAPSYAYDGRVATPASTDSVRQLLRLSSLDKVLIGSIKKGLEAGNRVNPEQWVDIDIYMSFITPDALVDRFAPIYAAYLSRDYAAKLIAAYETPSGKEAARLTGLEADSGPAAARARFAKLPPPMQKAVNDFQRSVAYTSLLNAHARAHEQVKTAFHNWSAEVMKERMAQVSRELAAILEDDMKRDEAQDNDAGPAAEEKPLPEKLSTRTGVRYLDDEALSLFISYRQNADLNRQLRRAMEGVKLDDILKPEYLSSRDGIEAANLRVLTLDGVLDSYDEISERILQNYNKNISRIRMPADERKRLEDSHAKALAVIIDEQIRENELRRNLIELVKRTISFCESRLDKIRHEDGKLVFYESRDLDAYRDLIAQINRQLEETRKLTSEERARIKAAIEKLKAV